MSEGTRLCQHLDPGFQPPRRQVNVFLQFSAAQSVVLCYGSPRKMKQPSAIRGFTEMGDERGKTVDESANTEAVAKRADGELKSLSGWEEKW